ncbi:MAG: ATP-binding protein [Mucilaginibacter sp.]
MACKLCNGHGATHLKHHLSFTAQVQEFFTNIFNTDSWPARWHCGTWTDFHGWLYILSDIGIWAAYFAIPLLIIRILIKRKNIPFYKIFGLFVAFILLCGLTHLFDAITFWWPAYRLNALLRFATAVVSVTTVYALYKVLPMVFQLRSVTELEEEIEKRRVIEEKLAASEFLLSEAGRIGRVGGWEYDIAANKSTWSKTIYDIYEIPYDYPIDNGNALDFFKEPYHEAMTGAIHQALADGKRWDLELVLTTANGTLIWIRSIGEPYYDAEGKMIKLRGVCLDIDQYKSNELALNRSLEMITQNNQQLKNFTHILSHNIRNHASNISLISSLIDTDTLDEDNADIIGKIKNISAGLNTTLDDLAEAIKIKENVIAPEKLSFTEVTNHVLEILESVININGAEIKIEFDIDTVNFPAIYLESIIMNLLTNALKYSKPAESPVIRLSTRKDEQGRTVLECRDNGMGIDLALHGKKIFGLYKTFHERKDARGVGLFLVKTQIESQGGYIIVESKPGVGSTFKIIFNEKN